MAKFPYDVIHLYYPKEKDNEQTAVYSFIKSLGRHQTEIVTQIMVQFLGEENIRDYSNISKKEIIRILKDRMASTTLQSTATIKEPGITKKDLEEITSVMHTPRPADEMSKPYVKKERYLQPEKEPLRHSEVVSPLVTTSEIDAEEEIEEIPDISLMDEDEEYDSDAEIAKFVTSMFDDGQG